MQLKLKEDLCRVLRRCCDWWKVSKGVCEVSCRAGDFLLEEAPWSGRPVEVDSDQIESFIENNQHYTTWEIANILKISKSVKLLVKMKNMSSILWNKPYRLFGQPDICMAYT